MKGRVGVLLYLGVAALVLGAYLGLAGCQKETPKTPVKTMTAKPSEATPGQPVAQLAEQTMCPVMGGAIDKTIFTEYKGKKVYFCCKGCVDTFNANPEKYVAKLPQFAK
jgi:YHS domain-containing protein